MRSAGMSTARIDAYRDDHEEDHHRATPLQGQRLLRHRAPRGTRHPEFPKQPSRKDGLGTMCTGHWRAYVKGLREARKVAKGPGKGEEADAA